MSFLIALVLLFAQSNCELALPGLMSDIVDVGVSQSGIASVVPNEISEKSLKEVELFLAEEEVSQVEEVFSTANADGVREFIGDKEERAELEEFLAPAEMLVAQLHSGMPIDSLIDSVATHSESELSPSAISVIKQQLGDTVTIDTLYALIDAGMVSQDQLPAMANQIQDTLGANGETVITGRAIEFVKSAYTEIGIDLNKVQSDYLTSNGLRMLSLALLSAMCAILAAFNASKTAAAIARDLRHDLYSRVLSFSPAEMDTFSAASLITRGTNDIQQVQVALVMCLRMVLFAPCMGIGAVVHVVQNSTGLEWIVITAVVTISVVIGVLMGLTMPKFKNMQNLVDKNNLIAREILTGLMPIRAFGRAQYEEERYDAANRELTGTYIFTNRAMAFLMPMMLVVMNATTVGIVWFGAAGVDAGALMVGDLMAYINYVMQVIMSFMVITMISVMLPRASVAAGRIQDVLSTDSSILDPADDVCVSKMAKKPEENTALSSCKNDWVGEVAFNDVTFSYPGADLPTLENISFTARPGKTTAIIGSTGSGKTTLVQLIPRLYDTSKGSVTIDGVDIRNIKLDELRSFIGYVPQKRMLFSGTIESNIKYGNEDMPHEQMIEAASIAQATEFIDSKPDKYESAIAQGGNNVSGGQNQRLSIARALAIKPKVLIFDDSFSALDYKTDSVLRATLNERMSDATIIIVAQRIATIMHAEEILVLDEGKIVGRGTHEELLRNCPEYLEIASSQLSPEELGLEGGER